MNIYEICSLIISLLTAIGTCGATILALYFWFHDNKIKLTIRAFHGDSYGALPKIENGYFLVALTNCSNWPIILETVGLKAYRRKYFLKKRFGFMMFENTSFDSLPKRLEYGQTYQYAISMNEMQNKFSRFKENNHIIDLKVFACVSTARGDLNFDLTKALKFRLLNQKKKDETH